MRSLFVRSANRDKAYHSAKRDSRLFCSQFVIKVLKNAGINFGIKPLSSPKVLEACLRNSGKFEIKHNIGTSGVKDVWSKIVENLSEMVASDPKNRELVSHILSGLAELKTSEQFAAADQARVCQNKCVS